ncbi:peptidoglycan editing factor PgeF [Pseudalkalibacillus hwajinpoensis]|uniref:peptidoglycan editing factor PgeF n=1 Tax=Guptibacillus hwajinpoensis TaxID=208199 RepID=UPI00325B451E
MGKEPFQNTVSMTSLALSFSDKADRGHALTAGFSTRKNGVSQAPFSSLNLGFHVQDQPEDVLSNRMTLGNAIDYPIDHWVVGEQVHGALLAKVSTSDCGRGVRDHKDAIKDVDGLYTDDHDVLLTALYADCVPLFFYAPSVGRVGIAHAGWKGTTKDIAGEMIRAWKADGITSEDIYTAIGPSIGKCCYEVDDGVIDQVKTVVEESEVFFVSKPNGKFQLDLKAVNRSLLRKAGIQENHIATSDYCTSCSSLFFSHRNEKGRTGRMMGYIGLGEV